MQRRHYGPAVRRGARGRDSGDESQLRALRVQIHGESGWTVGEREGDRVIAAVLLLAQTSIVTAPTGQEWILEQDLAIGTLESSTAAFGQIAGLTVDLAGNIFVSDAQSRDVKVF